MTSVARPLSERFRLLFFKPCPVVKTIIRSQRLRIFEQLLDSNPKKGPSCLGSLVRYCNTDVWAQIALFKYPRVLRTSIQFEGRLHRDGNESETGSSALSQPGKGSVDTYSTNHILLVRFQCDIRFKTNSLKTKSNAVTSGLNKALLKCPESVKVVLQDR